MRSTGHAWSYKAWCSTVISRFSTALIGAFRSFLLHSVICSLYGPQSHGSPVVVFFDRGHPRFWDFYSTIPVDVVGMNSCMNCLLDPARVVMRVTINFTSVQSGLCLVLWAYFETAEVSVRAGRMPRSCSLILSCIGPSVSPMYTLQHSQGIL